MPEHRTTLTAEGAQYFDVMRRAVGASDRLGASGARIGEGFLRGDRAVRVASQNISSALLTAGDATSTLLIAASGLERVFRIGIGPTIAVAAGVKAFEVMHDQVKKANDAYKDLKDELAKPLNTDPITAEADKKIDDLTEKVKKLHKEAESPVSKTTGIFAALAGIAGSTFLPQILRGPLASALGGLAPPGPGQLQQVSGAAAQRLDQLAAQKGQKILDAADKLHQALAEAVMRFRNSTGNLFRDVGSGQFLKDLQQRNLENQQTQAGQATIAELEDAVTKGIPLGPNAAAMLTAARAAAAKGGVTLEDITQADFSNLDLLSKYDFSGLAPLANISIIIK